MLETQPAFPIQDLKHRLHALAERNVYVGTSSWKYPGWQGQLYEEQRYLYRGRFSESRFERECLEEYAQIFRTVCLDAGYYRFPSPQYISGLCAQVPEGFRFGMKVTDDITARTFPNLPRHGNKAGKRNEHFLNADLFHSAYLASLEKHRDKVGLLIFEFSHFHPRDFARGRDFVEMLDLFLGKLPTRDWQFGVEVRNRSLLQPDYFATLRQHGVTHVYNHWTKMPPVIEQMQMEGSLTNDEYTAARFLLKPGRSYEEAVQKFSPYNATKEVNEEARKALAELIHMRAEAAEKRRTRPSFFFVNNRMEGSALMMILAALSIHQSETPQKRYSAQRDEE